MVYACMCRNVRGKSDPMSPLNEIQWLDEVVWLYSSKKKRYNATMCREDYNAVRWKNHDQMLCMSVFGNNISRLILINRNVAPIRQYVLLWLWWWQV